MKRIRAAITTGIIWAAAWGCAGGLVARVPGYDSDLPFAFLLAPFGFVTGLVFSGILMAIEGPPGVDRMSPSRFAGCGALIGLVLSAIFPYLRGNWREMLVFGPVLAVASAIAAAGSVAMARRVARTR